jgi:periplasmic protein TonB
MEIALTQEEEKNRKIAAGISITLHVIILLLLFYLLAWNGAPGKPSEEIGIEINFGTSAVGSGDVQSKATPNESKNVQDSKPAPTQPDPLPEPKPVAAAVPTPPTPVEAPKVVTTTAEAAVSVKEVEKPQPKPQPKPEEVKKTVEQPKEEPKKEPEKPRSLYPGKPTESTGTGKSGTSNEATGNNNGDDANKVGDKGDPAGSLDAKAMMGKPGGGGGGDGLDMAGWGWGNKPVPKDASHENGKIVIRIVINADGVVESATVIESTVSPHIAKIYRDEVFKRATFVRTGSSGKSGTTGTITYILRSN